MKPFLAILVVLPVLAQAPSAQQPTAAPVPTNAPAAKPAPAATPAPAASTDAASPVPSTEPLLNGWVDLGYLWNTGVGGSYDTFRSIIDIHSGPKLLGADFTLTDPKHRWFDTIQVRSTTWGAEPSSSLHVEA